LTGFREKIAMEKWGQKWNEKKPTSLLEKRVVPS
jgi:hypothetical protein